MACLDRENVAENQLPLRRTYNVIGRPRRHVSVGAKLACLGVEKLMAGPTSLGRPASLRGGEDTPPWGNWCTIKTTKYLLFVSLVSTRESNRTLLRNDIFVVFSSPHKKENKIISLVPLCWQSGANTSRSAVIIGNEASGQTGSHRVTEARANFLVKTCSNPAGGGLRHQKEK